MATTAFKNGLLALAVTTGLLAGGCTTLPSCAWGKCASPRTFALAPQTSERVYPLSYEPIFLAVKEHLERRGYPLAVAERDRIETEPYAEKEFARFLGIRYRWVVQIRKMDWLNTAVTPRLYLHEEGRLPRELTPGLWPEPYRYFYYQIEARLREAHLQPQTDPAGRS
jgi:hypothetical protein